MSARLAVAALVVVTLGAVCSFAIMLHRIDNANAEIAWLRRDVNALIAKPAPQIPPPVRLDGIRADLELCRRRTESLRSVLEVLIPSGIWPERVRLPDPPPGWEPWPTPGGYKNAPPSEAL